jgi:hypothetical protein
MIVRPTEDGRGRQEDSFGLGLAPNCPPLLRAGAEEVYPCDQ